VLFIFSPRKPVHSFDELLILAVAFVLISAESGVEDEVRKQILKVDHVTEAYVVYGIYDIVAKVEADTLDEVKQTVSWKIRELDHVEATMTLLVAEHPIADMIELPRPRGQLLEPIVA
jgi:DNA-binding Lrp family transcriptional regulator